MYAPERGRPPGSLCPASTAAFTSKTGELNAGSSFLAGIIGTKSNTKTNKKQRLPIFGGSVFSGLQVIATANPPSNGKQPGPYLGVGGVVPHGSLEAAPFQCPAPAAAQQLEVEAVQRRKGASLALTLAGLTVEDRGTEGSRFPCVLATEPPAGRGAALDGHTHRQKCGL